MRWMLNLDGGPKRVNHAAVAINDKIYSFGGYTATEIGNQNDFIDVHVLNTFTYRWKRLPLFPIDKNENKQQRSATISGTSPDKPTTSRSSLLNRRRARSLSDTGIHPLVQIRLENPPLDDDVEEHIPVFQHHGSISRPVESNPVSPTISAEVIHEQEEQQMDLDDNESGSEEVDINQQQRLELREIFARIDQQNLELEGEGDYDLFDVEMETDEDDDDDDFEEDDDDDDEPRILIEINGLGEVEVPIGVDLTQLAKFQQHPEIPFKRYGHTVVAYKNKAYLWGGRNDTYGCRQTLHCYDPVQNQWTVVQSEGQCPPARDGHSAVVWGDYMYIYGGYEERELRFSQETYAFHFPTSTWTKVKTSGEPPQYRDFHAACVLDGKMYVFGGRSDETGQLHTSHDVYDDRFRYLDLRTFQWHLIEGKPGEQHPCGRRSHTMWTYEGAIYLFGGYQSILNYHFDDLWRFQNGKWEQLNLTGQVPSPRRRSVGICVGDRLFLFGGTMPNPRKKSALEDLGDLFVLDFKPTLASLCLQAVLKHGLQKYAENFLPNILQRELYYMSTPNEYSKSSCRLGTNMRG